MSLQLATSILSEPFLMLDRQHQALVLYAVSQMKGESKDEPPFLPNPKAYVKTLANFATSSNIDIKNAPKGAVAIIPIKGTMITNDYTSWSGTLYPGSTTISSWIMEAYANPNILGIILDIDSGGGMAAAGEEINSAVSSVINKPIISVFGTMASAAYYAGSASKQIIANKPSSMAGSIGTMVQMYDYSKMYADWGIVKHEIYATASTDKNKISRDALAGNYEGMQKDYLDPMNEMFLSAVKTGRSGKINTDNENVLSGKMYYADKAKKAGLTDGDGGMTAAVKAITKLSNNQKSTNMSLAKKFAVLAATMGWAEFESTAEGVHIQEDALQTLEDALTIGATSTAGLVTSSAELVTANATIATMTTEAATAATANADLKKSVASLTVQVAALSKKPSGTGTATTTTKDETVGGVTTSTSAYVAAEDPANAWLAEQMGTSTATAEYDKIYKK